MASPESTGIYLPSQAECIDLPSGAALRLVRRVGGGGFGDVWEAHIDGTEHTVVVKRPHCRGDDADQARRERLRNELHLLAGVDLPGIPRLLTSGMDHPQPYAVYERVIGPTGRMLANRTAQKPLVRDALLRLALDLAESLAALHADGIIHSDVKPDNVLVGRIDGRDEPLRAWLVDFGLARRDDTALTRITVDGCTLGTHGFLDPRTVGRGEERDSAADVYGWAATVFEWHAGFPLFTKDQWWELLRLREAAQRGDDDNTEAWVQWHLGGRRAAIDTHRRWEALEGMLLDVLRWPTQQHPRPTAATCAQRLREIIGHRRIRLIADANGMPTTERQLPAWRLGWIAAGVLAGASALFAAWQREGPPPVETQAATPALPAPSPNVQWTNDVLTITDERGVALRVLRDHAHELGGEGSRAWVFSLEAAELCTFLERFAPGSGAKLPSPRYTCYGFAMTNKDTNEALISFPRICVYTAGATMKIISRNDLGADPDCSKLLMAWPGTFDRYVRGPATDTPHTQYLTRANAYLRALRRAMKE